ncbi:MAG TPA: SufS family cysteine desulfurase [Thermoplasmata archaeon]|nr:SufS family cysteine desulfurase [Thermoplasmata archaeon]
MDVPRIRQDFPTLQRVFHGHPLAYLDSAATSQKPQAVIDAVSEFYRERNANVHRGVYALSEEATDAFEQARERVARFLHAEDPSEIIFTRGTTESINLAASCLGRSVLGPGTRVVSTLLEHHSNIVPWLMLRDAGRCAVDYVDVDANGRLVQTEYDQLLGAHPKVVTLAHVSNVLGTVNPVKEMAERAHAVGATVIVDAAQSAPHRPVDVRDLGADLLAFSGHKLLGPTGIGVLWGRAELLRRLPPYMGGGEMIREVHKDRVSYRDPPQRFEAGTPDVGGAIGLGAAIDYLQRVGLDEIQAHESSLTEHAHREALERFEGRLRVYGPPPGEDRDAIFSFALDGVHPHDIASLLDAEGIAIRSGHHCAQPLMERLGVPALARASCYLYTLPEELDRMFDALGHVEELFARGKTTAAT